MDTPVQFVELDLIQDIVDSFTNLIINIFLFNTADGNVPVGEMNEKFVAQSFILNDYLNPTVTHSIGRANNISEYEFIRRLMTNTPFNENQRNEILELISPLSERNEMVVIQNEIYSILDPEKTDDEIAKIKIPSSLPNSLRDAIHIVVNTSELRKLEINNKLGVHHDDVVDMTPEEKITFIRNISTKIKPTDTATWPLTLPKYDESIDYSDTAKYGEIFKEKKLNVDDWLTSQGNGRKTIKKRNHKRKRHTVKKHPKRRHRHTRKSH